MAKIQDKVVVGVTGLCEPYRRMLKLAHANARAARKGSLCPDDEAYLARVYAPMSVPELTEFLEKMNPKARQDFQEVALGQA